ncbi:DUF1702 family protein [Nocardia rhizosphaerae]|uniref:DUF1702 family protein n=1 Tax=Nocardia rhizosphaerae TaxID=1691571 RepID=A0ABV8LBN4_9NOCA
MITKVLTAVVRRTMGLTPETFYAIVADRIGPQPDEDEIWAAIKPVPATLLDGFYAAMETPDHRRLLPRLDEIAPDLRGLAYEGAGMGLAVLDVVLPYKRRLPEFLAGPGAPYRMLIHIGIGVALPRLPRNPVRYLDDVDPFLRWMVLDGYGFHDGFFAMERTLDRQLIPAGFTGYARRAFDQGVGRSMWFTTAADVERVLAAVDAFPIARQGDLWSGIGVACAYAKDVTTREMVEALAAGAGPHASHFACGIALAAVLRQQSGLPAPHTDLACDVVWARSANEVAAEIALPTSTELPELPDQPAYEVWRTRIRQRWHSLADAEQLGREVRS